MRTSNLTDPFSKVFCMRIEPRYGSGPIYLTSYPTSLYVKDNLGNIIEYLSEQGTEASDYDLSETFTPSVIELKGVFGQFGVTREKILRGDFEGARIYVFATSWKAPIKDEEPIGVFIFGKPKITDNTFTLELIHILDTFNATPTLTYAKTCSNTFGDKTPDGEDVPLSFCCVGEQADYVSGTLTGFEAEFPNKFSDDSRSESDDWFGAGYIQFYINDFWTHPFEVKSFTAPIFELFDAPLYLLAPGVEYRARAGCRKRTIDCRDKFNNMLGVGGVQGGFFGFDNIPNSQQSGKVGNF